MFVRFRGLRGSFKSHRGFCENVRETNHTRIVIGISDLQSVGTEMGRGCSRRQPDAKIRHGKRIKITISCNTSLTASKIRACTGNAGLPCENPSIGTFGRLREAFVITGGS